ncbi:MAG: glycosyltransferase [Caulobacteraceae bacterium]|nr:glycosyltransferase [Caulobacter sp.]
MRILHLIKHCNLLNGHVNVMVDLAIVHARAGHTVAVGSAGGSYEPFFAAAGIAHHRIAFERSPGAVLGGTLALLRLCRRMKPDVIHAHMMSSAVLGALASRLSGVPLVTTMHNSFDRHSWLMRLGDAVVAVSEAERNLLLGRGYPAAKVVAIRNGTVGTPRDTLYADAPVPEVAKPCILTLCGLHERKGVHHLIAAFARVAPDHPAWHLNIAGAGPDAGTLKALVEELGLGARVHFLGGVKNPKRLLEQADVFALASLADPSALVLTEARAAGCAMVATDVGGSAEALAFGAAGQLVPPGDPVAMAAVLSDLMAAPDRLQDWRQRSAQGLEPFTLERTAAKYLSLYESLRRDRASPAPIGEAAPL